MNTNKKKEEIFKSNKISLKTTMKICNAYVLSIFLYNCELWTLTKNKQSKDVSENYFKKIAEYKMARNNYELRLHDQDETNEDTIRKKWLSWFGHVSRLNKQTPAP